jgi:hypothetical protein
MLRWSGAGAHHHHRDLGVVQEPGQPCLALDHAGALGHPGGAVVDQLVGMII